MTAAAAVAAIRRVIAEGGPVQTNLIAVLAECFHEPEAELAAARVEIVKLRRAFGLRPEHKIVSAQPGSVLVDYPSGQRERRWAVEDCGQMVEPVFPPPLHTGPGVPVGELMEAPPHTRQSLEALARDNPDGLRRLIAGILGWKRGEYEEDDGAMGSRWFAPGSPIPYRELPRWHDRIDACVELWWFADGYEFTVLMEEGLEPEHRRPAMFVPPPEHCVAFILAAQEAGHANT